MVRVAGHASKLLRVNRHEPEHAPRSPSTPTLSGYEAIAILVEGATGPLSSSLRVERRRAAQGKPPIPIGVISLGATGDHHVGITTPDDRRSVADGVRAGRAGGDGGEVGPLQPSVMET